LWGLKGIGHPKKDLNKYNFFSFLQEAADEQ
jgi:hypothetical protein